MVGQGNGIHAGGGAFEPMKEITDALRGVLVLIRSLQHYRIRTAEWLNAIRPAAQPPQTVTKFFKPLHCKLGSPAAPLEQRRIA